MRFRILWQQASAMARFGLIVGVLAILAVTATLGHWAVSKDYQVLFADLSEQDAATMVAELDRMKLPYRLEERGTRILVPADAVHKTRLQLVGKNLPLHGAVGFEIFNNTDFGMTEFTQKVNYQRALQGELTRTIMALDEVQSARVHLALPESSLFKRDQNRPKASVTLAVKAGQRLEREQVLGVQRLVAAAVPGIDVDDVTVLDQRGAALSRRGEGLADGGGSQLDTKRQIEEYLSRKIGTVLDRAFGPGQGVVSVDVLLNFDHVKVTSEEVLPAKGSGTEGSPSGVMVRERQTQRDAPAGKRDAGEQAATSTVTNTDIEYQAGRRIEQIVSTPGSVRKISVGVVVPKGLSQERLDRVREVAAMAAGLDKQRGDGIAVYALDQMSDGPAALKPLALPAADAVPPEGAPARPEAATTGGPRPTVWMAGLAFALLAVALAWVASGQRRRLPRAGGPLALAADERSALLANVQQWLNAPPTPAEAEERKP